MCIISLRLIVEADEHILWFKASNYTFEHTGFAGTVTSKHSGHPSAFGGQKGALEDSVGAKLQMNAVNKHPVCLI